MKLGLRYLFRKIYVQIEWYNTSMKNLALNSVVYKEDKYFVSQCLAVDVSSFGETKQEALDNLKEALELRFEK